MDAILRALALPESQGPVGAAVRALLERAVGVRASDIHLIPTAAGLEIRFRCDGALELAGSVPSAHAEQFVGKVKVLAGLLTYRRDIPQDGHIPAADAAGAGDARVSVFPTIDGERVVIRLFPEGTGLHAPADLGFDGAIVARLVEWSRRPDGVVLLTGPSGSGKTTTIYAMVEEALRAGGRRHVVTIEDPVERRIPGATQTQVNPAVGLTFASALRSLLRHDPEVIMVGEIRDGETARVAMEAGLTGHWVVSTIHAGAAVGVIVRLREMGIEGHVITSALVGALAQRLARRICARCGGAGCAECRRTGFAGRRVFGELLRMTDALRAATLAGADRAALQAQAEREGLVPLAAAGEALVREGVTTRAEIERLLGQ